MADILINDPSTGSQAKVTGRGQLVTAPLEFSNPISNCLTCACTAVNFFAATSGKILVVTEIVVSSGAGGTQTIEIYEATSSTETTVAKQIFSLDLAARTVVPLTGLNWALTQGVWLNAKSSGTTSMVTIAGYFIDA